MARIATRRLWGIDLPEDAHEVDFHLKAYLAKLGTAHHALGPYRHFNAVSRIIWPTIDWHAWTTRMAQAFCEYNANVWAGCATASKTFNAGLFAVIWWLADPSNSSAVLTSTTAKSIRRRVWPVIQRLYTDAHCPSESILFGDGFPGNMVDSKTMLQAAKGDDKHGIFAIAVREGPINKAVGDIQGLHSKRMLIVIDEATETPEAIFAAIPNLIKATDFYLIVIGNPSSHLDPHGYCAEPVYGWNTITVEDEEWETKGVPKWQVPPGICLHFDGTKSPNIKEPGKYPYLYSETDLKRSLSHPEAQNTAGFWKFDRGFWPGETVTNTVFSEALIEKYEGRGEHIFISTTKPVAGLDPSWSVDGDGCILKFGVIGDLENNRLGVQITETFKIPIVRGKEIAYQVAEFTIEQCKLRGLAPKQLGIDASGGGFGVADIIERNWGYGLNRVVFRASPSERPVSDHDGRPAKDVYANRATECWFKSREFLIHGQLKGIDTQTAIDWCAREWEWRGERKMALQDKEIAKKQLGHSPDDGDAAAILLDTAATLGVTVEGEFAVKADTDWIAKAKEMAEVYEQHDTGPWHDALEQSSF